MNKVDGTDDPFDDERMNGLVAISPKWTRAKLRTARCRLADRNETARSVRPWASELIGLGPHRSIDGNRKFTQRQIALWLCGGAEEKAIRFQERVWRPTRPVLHYAIAIDETLAELNSAENAVELDLRHIAVFRAIVERGEQLAPRIAADPRFAIDPDQQLHLIWQE
jgi:hypothetical protein